MKEKKTPDLVSPLKKIKRGGGVVPLVTYALTTLIKEEKRKEVELL